MFIFPSLLLPINSFFFFFSLISVLGTHAIKSYILSISFTINFETFYFIRQKSDDSIPTSNKHRLPDHLSVPNGFHFRSERYQAVLEFDWFSIDKDRLSCDQWENYLIFISIYIQQTQLTVKRMRMSNTCVPRVQCYRFLTLKSDFCQIRVFEVSGGVIGFSVLNRETLDQIRRVGKHGFVQKRLENNVRHGIKNAVYQYFSFFHNVFKGFL